MPDIRVVGIMAKPGIPHASAIVSELVEWLHARGVEARLDPETAVYLDRTDGLAREKVPEGAQLVIVLGGDGTLLAAARAVAGSGWCRGKCCTGSWCATGIRSNLTKR